MDTNKAIAFVPLPDNAPSRDPLIGHDTLRSDRYHGALTLNLTALTPVFLAAGITALGRDVGEEDVPLLKVMMQNGDGYPLLQGPSVKGCLRSVYETITNSTFGAGKPIKKDWKKQSESERRLSVRNALRGRRGGQLSPAELVFGAMGFQGLVSIADAVGDRPMERGILPAMFQPQKGNGRKFYRHHRPNQPETNAMTQSVAAPIPPSTAIATDRPTDRAKADPADREPDTPASPIQQAAVGTVFTTTLRFTNLSLAQLGALLIAMGQDKQSPFALKIGGGKGKGLGSIKISLVSHKVIKGESLKQSRYLDYDPAETVLDDQALDQAIATAHAHETLIHQTSLDALQQILHYDDEEGASS